MLENKLNELNIFALRDLARRTGVKAPTSKKKEELIKGIIEIMSGEKQPLTNKTKQGRPPKVFGYDFANVFNMSHHEVSSKLSLSQSNEEVEDDEMLTVAGWLEIVNNNAGILWVNRNLKNENFFIPSDVLKCIETKMGDRVVAEVSVDENQKVVKKIFSINDYPVSQIESRVDFFSVEHFSTNRPLVFENKEYSNLGLNVGENIYIYGENNNENTKTIVDMLKSCKIQNKIYLNISIAEKNKSFFSGLENTENFVANITDEVDIVRRIVALSIERAKRILEVGEDVLFVVDDVLSIVGIDKENLNFVKKLASIAKEGNNGSITLLAVMPNESIVQIEKLADKRLKIENIKSK